MATVKAMSRHRVHRFSPTRPLPVLQKRIAQLRTAPPRLHKNRHHNLSTAVCQIDFVALEAKWQAKWDNRKAHVLRDESAESDIFFQSPQVPPLSPFYLRHLRKPTTILETLEWHYGKTSVRTVNKEHAVFDRIFQCSRAATGDLGTYIRKYGVDIIRTSLVFNGRKVEDLNIDEAEIEETRGWFYMIQEATALAHDTYIVDQCGPTGLPDIPGAFYEPGLDTWTTYLGEEHLRWVQVPPEEPEVPQVQRYDVVDYSFWLVVQEAISAFTVSTTARSSIRTIKSRLMELTKAIITRSVGLCDLHYYSARILLSLLAPLAPSFAEECWVILHYGCHHSDSGCHDSDSDGFEPIYDASIEVDEQMIKEIEEDNNRRHLPRQGRPDTLQSIFDQPFPVAKLDAVQRQ